MAKCARKQKGTVQSPVDTSMTQPARKNMKAVLVWLKCFAREEIAYSGNIEEVISIELLKQEGFYRLSLIQGKGKVA